MDLFVYGTLTDAHLVAELTGRRFRTQAAILRGYRRIVPDGGYPYIVADADAAVDGVLLCAVDPQTLDLLDHYEAEGHLYERRNVIVSVSGHPRDAAAYVGIPERHRRA